MEIKLFLTALSSHVNGNNQMLHPGGKFQNQLKLLKSCLTLIKGESFSINIFQVLSNMNFKGQLDSYSQILKRNT